VCDDPSAVDKLLKKSRKVMGQETDMVRLQLVEMSDYYYYYYYYYY
jgi:hypothetical protein